MPSSPTLLAGQDMTALAVGAPAWTAMTLINSWGHGGAGTVLPQYRLWPLLNSVELIGVLGATISASAFFVLPAGNIPASTQGFPVGTFGGASGNNNSAYLQCDTSGNLTIVDFATGVNTILFHGWISLDA